MTTDLTDFYIEWAPNLAGRRGNMLPVASVSQILKQADPGYRSVYLFNKTDAESIKENANSQNFQSYEVGSTCLFIDIDDVTSKDRIRAVADALNVDYKLWFSGSKGFHLEIRCKPMLGKDVPYSQMVFVQQLNITGADMSIYRTSSLISLPGRIHPKTGMKKRLVDERHGYGQLDIPIVPRPQPVFDFSSLQFADTDHLALGFSRLSSILSNEPDIGGRHTSLWGTAKDLFQGGLDEDTIRTLLQAVNQAWQNPKTDEEVEAALTQALRSGL